ncbi:MAG: hypothetical protein ACK5MR_10225 [Cumulibacter sp.]
MLATYQPYIDAFLKWTEDYGDRFYVMSSELQMYNTKYDYAGTIDLIIYDSALDKFGVLDFKTTAQHHENMVAAQLGAYKNMLEL